MGRFINGRTNLEFMTWRNHFNRAKRTDSPILVNKEHIGPIPPGFEQQGFALNGVWGTYERKQGLETIRIRELPTQYHISVSNPIAENKSFTQLNLSRNQYGQTNPTTAQQKPSLKKIAIGGLGFLGILALGQSLGNSDSSSTPDPAQSHRVFISHSWQYKEHYKEVQSLLDGARNFDYFDHSVTSNDPIDAQLPNHLRKKLRDQMRSASVVLVLAGMYVAHSDWIKEEIEMAADMEKPIIGVIPPKNDLIPNIVDEHATELVQTDGNDILDAIERQAT